MPCGRLVVVMTSGGACWPPPPPPPPLQFDPPPPPPVEVRPASSAATSDQDKDERGAKNGCDGVQSARRFHAGTPVLREMLFRNTSGIASHAPGSSYWSKRGLVWLRMMSI